MPNITRHQRPRRPEKEEGPGRGGGGRREGGGKERRNSWYYLQPPSNPQSLIYTTTNSGKLRPTAPENKHDFFLSVIPNTRYTELVSWRYRLLIVWNSRDLRLQATDHGGENHHQLLRGCQLSEPDNAAWSLTHQEGSE